VTLVDTSVWVDHLRRGSLRLSALLDEAQVLCHPFISGELACGNLHNRTEILSLLAALPQAQVAEHEEVLELLSVRRLHGLGLGWVDAHLLASALLSRCPLWTLDKALDTAAIQLGVSDGAGGS
jgi:predicted nucleic acid-binding protein